MASEYPLSTFVGVDMAPVFPEVTQTNVAFLRCNILDGLPFPDETFDFVRQGFLIVSIDWHEWKDKMVKELMRVTKTGGYIEVMDLDVKYHRAGELCKYLTSFGKSSLIFSWFVHVSDMTCLPFLLRLFITYVIVIDHFEKIGIKPLASRDVLKALGDLNDAVTVSPMEEKVHPLGSWGGKLGELVSKTFSIEIRFIVFQPTFINRDLCQLRHAFY